MSSGTLVSVQEYLRRTEKPNTEYVDGVLCRKPMPAMPHSLIQAMLILLLGKQGVRALPELTVRLSAYLVPDVVVARSIDGPYPTEPVELCIEILSPDSRLGAMLEKCEQYHGWGVPYCWVIDPQKRTAWQYHSGSEPERVGILTAGELKAGLTDLFSELPSHQQPS